MVAPENYKRSTLEWAGILACTIRHMKKVIVSELREIARVAYLGQITNIGSGRARKLLIERTREARENSVHDWAHEKGCCLKITRNRIGSIFMPSNEYWKQSRENIIKGALLGQPGY